MKILLSDNVQVRWRALPVNKDALSSAITESTSAQYTDDMGNVLTTALTVEEKKQYGFTKFRFPGRSILLYLIIIVMMMPIQVSLVPQYLVLDWMNLLGSYWALIFPRWFAAFGIFLMTQIYQRFPDDILEAAQVVGAGELRKFWNIVLPNSLSGICSLMILSFIDNWNMVEQPLIFLQDYRMYPLSVFLSFINEDNLGIAFACGTLNTSYSLGFIMKSLRINCQLFLYHTNCFIREQFTHTGTPPFPRAAAARQAGYAAPLCCASGRSVRRSLAAAGA